MRTNISFLTECIWKWNGRDTLHGVPVTCQKSVRSKQATTAKWKEVVGGEEDDEESEIGRGKGENEWENLNESKNVREMKTKVNCK